MSGDHRIPKTIFISHDEDDVRPIKIQRRRKKHREPTKRKQQQQQQQQKKN